VNIDFTNDTIFGFDGPNLCLLGNEGDFKNLAESILPLTVPDQQTSMELASFQFMTNVGDEKSIIFSSKNSASYLGIFRNEVLIFELDSRYWERLFKFFVLMSWKKSTYYLNSFEDCLRDLPLDQECHLICSSEF
jgi:hypothetical protein